MIMKRCLRLVPIVGVILMLAGPVQAHHSFAMFDKDKPTVVKGVVSKVEWRNPHIFIFVDVPDSDGNTTKYAMEGNSPNVLMRGGWKRSTLKTGDDVSIHFYPLRDGRPGGLLDKVVFSNGEEIGG